MAILVIVAYYIRNMLILNVKNFFLTFACILFGAIILHQIHRLLIRFHGPQILHVNVVIMLYAHFSKLIQSSLARNNYMNLYLAGAGIALIIISVLFLFSKRIFFRLQNIKSKASHRFLTLELRGIDEGTLDLLGFTCMIFFLGAGSLLSLILGWQDITSDNFNYYILISVGILVLVWMGMVLTGRILSAHDSFSKQLRQGMVYDFIRNSNFSDTFWS